MSVSVVVVGGGGLGDDSLDGPDCVSVVASVAMMSMSIGSSFSFGGDSSSFDLSGEGHEGGGECEFHCDV